MPSRKAVACCAPPGPARGALLRYTPPPAPSSRADRRLSSPRRRPPCYRRAVARPRSSAGQSGGFLIRRSQVRVLPGSPASPPPKPRANLGAPPIRRREPAARKTAERGSSSRADRFRRTPGTTASCAKPFAWRSVARVRTRRMRSTARPSRWRRGADGGRREARPCGGRRRRRGGANRPRPLRPRWAGRRRRWEGAPPRATPLGRKAGCRGAARRRVLWRERHRSGEPGRRRA